MGSKDATGDTGGTRPDLSATVVKSERDDGPVFEIEAGATIGRYVVLGTLGAGAMGTVYRAYDPELHREVALKQIRRDGFDEHAATRLIREARAMAQLSHPNVVAVHDVVVDGGRVSLAMELVAGGTLSEWLDRAHGVDEVLALLVGAGQGLAAAHQAGLVHRDFKPANVLVTPDGVAKVTDFGLVKAVVGGESGSGSLDEAPGPLDVELTSHTTVVGTPRYMAPEQMTGRRADAAADQYAFCIVAWLALTGQLPFVGTDAKALVLEKVQGPPPFPSEGRVPAAVRRAIARGLAPQPADRWPDMPTLLAAIQPAPSALRRWWPVAAVIVAGGAAVAAAAGVDEDARCDEAAATLDEVWSTGHREALARVFQGSPAAYAAEAGRNVDAALEAYSLEWRRLRRETCEATLLRKEQSTAAMDRQVGCLQDARTSFEATLDVLRQADDEVLARGHALLSDLPPLERCADAEALASAMPAAGVDVDPVLLRRLREGRAKVNALNTAGRHRDAAAIAEELWPEVQGLEGTRIRARIGAAYAVALAGSGQIEAAVRVYRDAHANALQVDDALLAADIALDIAFHLNADQSRPDEAMWFVRYAEAVSRQPEASTRLQGRVLSIRGQIHRRTGHWDEAARDAEAALQLRIDTLGEDHNDVAVSRNNLGLLLYDLGREEEGAAHLRQALAVWKKNLGPEHPEVANGHNTLAMMLERTEHYDEAEREYREALRLREALYGPMNERTIAVRHNLGLVMMSRGETAAAEELIAAAVEQWEQVLSPDDPSLAIGYNSWGLALRKLGQNERALSAHETSVRKGEVAFGNDHPQMCQFWNNLARAVASDDPRRARELAERSLGVCESRLGVEHASVRGAREILDSLK